MSRIRLVSAIVLALSLAIASSIEAQEPRSLKQSIGTGILRGLYVATPIVHAVDGISTLRVVDLGGREMNPLIAPQVHNRAIFVATKAGIASAEIYLAHRIAKDHKLGAILALAGLHTGYALVAAHNFRVARGMQDQLRAIR